jgi:hypothetical protein
VKTLLFLLGLVTTTTLSAQDQTVIRIMSDPIKRDYKVLFSAQEEMNVAIALRTASGELIMEERFNNSKAFMKAYSLDDARVGKYEWEVSYGDESFVESFTIEPLKKLVKESIAVAMDELLNLTIEVAPYNNHPLSIFFYKENGDQLDFVFWEPSGEERKKTINLSQFDAYEVKLEILQLGDPAISEVYALY